MKGNIIRKRMWEHHAGIRSWTEKKLYTGHLLADIFHTGIFRYLFVTGGVSNDPRSFENIVNILRLDNRSFLSIRDIKASRPKFWP